jgi:hypothetical protein
MTAPLIDRDPCEVSPTRSALPAHPTEPAAKTMVCQTRDAGIALSPPKAKPAYQRDGDQYEAWQHGELAYTGYDVGGALAVVDRGDAPGNVHWDAQNHQAEDDRPNARPRRDSPAVWSVLTKGVWAQADAPSAGSKGHRSSRGSPGCSG